MNIENIVIGDSVVFENTKSVFNITSIRLDLVEPSTSEISMTYQAGSWAFGKIGKTYTFQLKNLLGEMKSGNLKIAEQSSILCPIVKWKQKKGF